MKTVKIHFVGFWNDLDFENNLFTNILKKRYHIVLDSVDPDFVFCSVLGSPFEYMKYNCPRIMFTGEPMSVDFTAIDYFIGFDDIQFGDRALRFPLFLMDMKGEGSVCEPLTEDEARKQLNEKEYFCNFIYGHQTISGIREQMFETISKYKRVESIGRFMNNMPDGRTIVMYDKIPFMRKCKFSIACESMRYPGFVSEKIVHAFDANTIPVYYGDPDVGKTFNNESFLDLGRFADMESMMNKIIEIDGDDDLYIHMLCQCRYNEIEYEHKMYKLLEGFLYNIFDQDKEEAYRRPRWYYAADYEKYLWHYNDMQGTIPWRLDRKCRNLAWKWRKLIGAEERRGHLID